MFTIARLQKKDLPAALKLFRRSSFAYEQEGHHFLSDYQEEEVFRDAMEKDILYALKEKGRVIALSIASHNLGGLYFPKSRSNYKSEALLERVGCLDEAILAIALFVVDPAYWGKGYGEKLLSFLEANNSKATLICLIEEDNEIESSFFSARGFFPFGVIEVEIGNGGPYTLYAKKHKRKGLASISF